jgi:micrococcal nuclease
VTAQQARASSVLPFAALALAAALAVIGCGDDTTGVAADLPDEPNAEVVRVVDGDTIVVETGGIEESVRLIGIDTPETVKPGSPVECYGKAASAKTEELLPEGTAVLLERDVEARDRYDRLLAYVYRVSDATFVNLELVEGGYALPATYPPNVAHTEDFLAASREARAEGRGLWTECEGEIDHDDIEG